MLTNVMLTSKGIRFSVRREGRESIYHPSAAGIDGSPSDWEDDRNTLPEAHSNFNQVIAR
ncbi:MAG: hypothetical protein AUH11_15285 [Acidobacteria bacterium 13_2_20CM_57_17]|nr:MAG: hypothetical protein AUH11_15285 [Acidobacteria bacterium 13_2_20CM_57_17]OLB97690.1 MAG: hypothetical protein AUI02_00705 [Acidobacteria bacterium 13_2_20CM_2_57_12]OLE16402.1 MAG: hypothetical protein AUG83_03205 [Acidobacteria bacterium 13_1_20CM_4_57_11]